MKSEALVAQATEITAGMAHVLINVRFLKKKLNFSFVP